LESKKNEKILVIQTAFPGDAILTLPDDSTIIKKEIKMYWIVVLAIPPLTRIFKASPNVNNVFVYVKGKKINPFLHYLKSQKNY